MDDGLCIIDPCAVDPCGSHGTCYVTSTSTSVFASFSLDTTTGSTPDKAQVCRSVLAALERSSGSPVPAAGAG